MKTILKIFLKIRWAYFHINPRYAKFYIGDEAYFQDMHINVILCNYSVKS